MTSKPFLCSTFFLALTLTGCGGSGENTSDSTLASPDPTPGVDPSPTPELTPLPTPSVEAAQPDIVMLENDVSIAVTEGKDGLVTLALEVPEGAKNLEFFMGGGVGDADMYVRLGQIPTLDEYSCRPYIRRDDELCTFENPTAGTYYINVYGYEDYYNVSLVGKYTTEEEEIPAAEPIQMAGCEITVEQKQLLDLHNAARSQGRQCGNEFYEAVPELTWNCTLEVAAEKHSIDMAENNFRSHTGSDGSSVSERVSALNYSYNWVGENIAWGFSSVDSAMNGWLNSSGHCSNIMNPNFTELGASHVASSTSDFPHYWTVDFGKPL